MTFLSVTDAPTNHRADSHLTQTISVGGAMHIVAGWID